MTPKSNSKKSGPARKQRVTTQGPAVTFAVLTDLHAFDKTARSDTENSRPAPSWLPIDDGASNPSKHPFRALEELISEQRLKADFVVCCGDMTDKAHPASQAYVWRRLQDIKRGLGAERVIATAGNHDIDSRYGYNNFDAKGVLQTLQPSFPMEDDAFADRYWSRNFAIFKSSALRLVNLNSAAYHGMGRENKEYETGRVSERTIDALSRELKADGYQALNVLLCHHHPLRNSLITVNDYSEMVDGEKLIQALDELNVGDWFILHGHRHVPNLTHGPGSAAPPIVFSAGSFSANLYGEFQSSTRNEFYLVSLEPSVSLNGTRQQLRGTIRTWMWSTTNGWIRSQAGSVGLPHEAGFGSRRHPSELAADVRNFLQKQNERQVPFTRWRDICDALPDLRHTMPRALWNAFEELRDTHGVEVVYDDIGLPAQLSLPDGSA
ncbi:MAG: hypothetical protein DCF16_18575 [Alphaproteobacteria bacterium]|nr:MAG: hypothetical protein DCF16_18575 [Alphaproteobacteria bacterium]